MFSGGGAPRDEAAGGDHSRPSDPIPHGCRPEQGFPSRCRLRHSREYTQIWRQGRRCHTTHLLVLAASSHDGIRLGISVGRKSVTPFVATASSVGYGSISVPSVNVEDRRGSFRGSQARGRATQP